MAGTRDKHDDSTDPLIGASLGGYEIKSRIGRGGYADVYLAVQTRLDREVALKVLREDGTGVAPEQIEAFLTEARTAAALDHSCLVHVHDVGESDGKHFLSMELLRGGNLARRIRRDGPLSWQDAVLIAMDVADALQCAHEHGMLHHDVKPANILLNRAGEAKLADLGLATKGGHAGTRAYMAPERIQRRAVDLRSDLYSLGCTLYAMLSGAPPFAKDTSKEMLHAHVHEAPVGLRAKGIEVPEVLDELVMRLLAKDPESRPESAQKTAELLEWVVEVATGSGAGQEDADAERPGADAREATPAASAPAEPESTSTSPEVRPRRRSRRRSRQAQVPWGTILGLLFLGAVIAGALWAWRKYG